ncbi:MAG: FTR1 family iron permease [Acaryochloridaceae cyanobacterium RU_4_10]|nr:FTR1 family iron permease [Acaryochloridaceae cyanobacterium RU_4_10]
MDISTALPTFVITLREGVEAALVVGIVLALLQKAQQPHLKVWVYGGIVAGLMASLLAGTLLRELLSLLQASDRPYATVLLPALKTLFSFSAIALLTWMLIWMTQQARTAKAEIEGAVTQVLQTDGRAEWGIWTLIFVAVLREGLETALFIVAQLQQGWMPVVGAIAGLIVATGIGWGLFALGIRINLKAFFQVMGVFLLLIVGGLVMGACKQLDLTFSTLDPLLPQTLCFSVPFSVSSCLLGPLVWDGQGILPDREFPGILLKTFLGYRDRLFLGQCIAYIVFMVVAGTLYWRSLSPKANVRAPAPVIQSEISPEESP